MKKPSKEILEQFYCIERISPEIIAIHYGVSGHTIRHWMAEYGIARLGPTHLRKGKSAFWNIGREQSQEWHEKQRASHLGRHPSNYGKGRIHFVCEICGKEVFDKPYRRSRTCSKKCKDQLSHIHRGEEHWNYKGENAGYIQRQRNWSQCREWRTEVLRLAGYTCAKCGVHGGRLTAHHLYTWNDNPIRRFDPANGACVCWKCHWAFHRVCSHHHTTPEMFQIWLTN